MDAALLTVNILLVILTGGYVVLTGKISTANAESARTAVAVAMATVDASFETKMVLRRLIVDPDPTFRSDYFNLGVRIRPLESNLLVHNVRIVNYMRATQSEASGKRTEAEGPIREQLEWSTNVKVPVRLHRKQSRRLYSPTTWVPKGYVLRVEVEVDYSLDGRDVATYRGSWETPKYEFHGAASMRIVRSLPGIQRWGDVQDASDPD